MKIGDYVRIVINCHRTEQEGIIISKYACSEKAWNIQFISGETEAFFEISLKLITNKNNNMNILEQIKLARKSEPEKTLVKAKLMNMDESLTSEGQSVLNDILVQEYKTKMKETADLIIAEEEKTKK